MMEPARESPYVNSVFEQPWWLEAVAPGNWKEAIITNDFGCPVARFPYCINRKKIYMPPYTQCLGVWFDHSQNTDIYHKNSAEKEYINALLSQILGEAKSVKIRLSPVNQYVLPYHWHGFRIEPHFTYRINELNDCQAVYSRFNKTVKKNIRSARNKVTIHNDLDIACFWELMNRTFEVQGRKNPMKREVVERIIYACDTHDAGKMLIAKDANGHVHSGAYLVYDQNVCYYLFAGSDPQYRNSGAQSLILWEAIQFASQHSRVFDFEGSMIESIELFFRRFGGECTLYYEIQSLSLLDSIWGLLKPRIKRILHYK